MKYIDRNPRSIIILSILLLGILLIVELFLRVGPAGGLAFTAIPIVIVIALIFTLNPYASMWLFVIVNYYITGLTRYFPEVVKSGAIMLAMSLFLLIVYLVSRWLGIKKQEEDTTGNAQTSILILLWGIWLIFILVHVFTPGSVFMAWLIAANNAAITPFLLAIAVPLIFNKFEHLKKFIFVFSILTLTAVAKAMMQQWIGFDAAEERWLFDEGEAERHIIWSGIRYFSFYSDAANFGAGMALASVVFGGMVIYEKRLKNRIYYGLVTILALYAMSMSGTRSAMIVIMVGVLVMLFLSKSWRILTVGAIAILFAIIFFRYTYIGNSYSEIRRIRSAFHFEKDASYKLRLSNQQQLRPIMASRPFGYGLGLSAQRTKRFGAFHPASMYPPDSYFVALWIETGIIGLSLFIIINALILILISIIIITRVKDKEVAGITSILVAGATGMMVSCYSNEVLIYPNGPIIYLFWAFAYLSVKYDHQVSLAKEEDARKLLEEQRLLEEKIVKFKEEKEKRFK